MRQIILLGVMLIYSVSMSAQASYYDTEKTFVEDGYTYQCIISYGKPIIYNERNELTDKEMTRKDGSYWGTGISNEYRMAPLLEDEAQQEIKYTTILNNAFASEYKNRIEDDKLFVRMAIDADLGGILEVSFSFLKNSGYATIPVSVYRQIEVELKKHIQYPVTDNGKKMNFIDRQIMYKYKNKSNQNYTDSIAAPKATQISSHSFLSAIVTKPFDFTIIGQRNNQFYLSSMHSAIKVDVLKQKIVGDTLEVKYQAGTSKRINSNELINFTDEIKFIKCQNIHNRKQTFQLYEVRCDEGKYAVVFLENIE